MKLIDKDKVAAEIKKRKAEAESNCGGYKSYDEHRCNACIVDFYEEFLEILDAAETKEVDLEKEIELVKGDYEQVDVAWNDDFDFIARHFYELGLKAQKGE